MQSSCYISTWAEKIYKRFANAGTITWGSDLLLSLDCYRSRALTEAMRMLVMCYTAEPLPVSSKLVAGCWAGHCWGEKSRSWQLFLSGGIGWLGSPCQTYKQAFLSQLYAFLYNWYQRLDLDCLWGKSGWQYHHGICMNQDHSFHIIQNQLLIIVSSCQLLIIMLSCCTILHMINFIENITWKATILLIKVCYCQGQIYSFWFATKEQVFHLITIGAWAKQ